MDTKKEFTIHVYCRGWEHTYYFTDENKWSIAYSRLVDQYPLAIWWVFEAIEDDKEIDVSLRVSEIIGIATTGTVSIDPE